MCLETGLLGLQWDGGTGGCWGDWRMLREAPASCTHRVSSCSRSRSSLAFVYVCVRDINLSDGTVLCVATQGVAWGSPDGGTAEGRAATSLRSQSGDGELGKGLWRKESGNLEA